MKHYPSCNLCFSDAVGCLLTLLDSVGEIISMGVSYVLYTLKCLCIPARKSIMVTWGLHKRLVNLP